MAIGTMQTQEPYPLDYKFYSLQWCLFLIGMHRFFSGTVYNDLSVAFFAKTLFFFMVCVICSNFITMMLFVLLFFEKTIHVARLKKNTQKNHLFKKSFLVNHKCPICYERSRNKKSIQFKQCKHTFHKKCIYKWINVQRTNCFDCPCCKAKYYTICEKP